MPITSTLSGYWNKEQRYMRIGSGKDLSRIRSYLYSIITYIRNITR